MEIDRGRLDGIFDDVSATLEPVSAIAERHGVGEARFYRWLRADGDAMQGYEDAVVVRHLRCFDEMFRKLADLEELAGDSDKHDNKGLWARQQTIKIALDNLKWIASRHPAFSDRQRLDVTGVAIGDSLEAAWERRKSGEERTRPGV